MRRPGASACLVPSLRRAALVGCTLLLSLAVPRGLANAGKKAKKAKARLRSQEFALPVPRVSAAELAEDADLLSGAHPFILVNETSSWPALQRWASLDHLAALIPQQTTDFYWTSIDHTMDKVNKTSGPFSEAATAFLGPRRVIRSAKYLQIPLTSASLQALSQDLLPLPEKFWSEDQWITKCMSDDAGAPDRAAIDNWMVVNQWKYLLIGDRDAGMYFHQDHLAAASWQAAVVGRKRWILCRNADAEIFKVPTPDQFAYAPAPPLQPIDLFKPDKMYKKFPRLAAAQCADVVVQPGEILYYPAYWFHQTKCLDDITIGLTGLMVGTESQRADLQRLPHEAFYKDVQHKCSRCWDGEGRLTCEHGKDGWSGQPIAYEICAKYLDRCMKLWQEHAATNDATGSGSGGGWGGWF
jgi:hypothetical protein